MASGSRESNADDGRAAIGRRGQEKAQTKQQKAKMAYQHREGKAWEVTVKGSWSQKHQSMVDVLGALLGIPESWPAGQGCLESMHDGF